MTILASTKTFYHTQRVLRPGLIQIPNLTQSKKGLDDGTCWSERKGLLFWSLEKCRQWLSVDPGWRVARGGRQVTLPETLTQSQPSARGVLSRLTLWSGRGSLYVWLYCTVRHCTPGRGASVRKCEGLFSLWMFSGVTSSLGHYSHGEAILMFPSKTPGDLNNPPSWGETAEDFLTQFILGDT